MPDYIDISVLPIPPSWEQARKALKDIIVLNIKPEITGARVYENWVYEIDANTMLGKVTAALRVTEGEDIDKVHAWTIGISAIDYEKNQFGEPPVIGAGDAHIDWELNIDVFGFMDNSGIKNAQKKFEDETRLVGMAINKNRDKLRELPGVSYVSAIRFPSLGPTPFSAGESIAVAAGAMRMRVKDVV